MSAESQLPLDLEPYDYAWQVQCTHHLVDERTGEPFRWVIGSWSQAHSERVAERIQRENPGVVAVVERR